MHPETKTVSLPKCIFLSVISHFLKYPNQWQNCFDWSKYFVVVDRLLFILNFQKQGEVHDFAWNPIILKNLAGPTRSDYATRLYSTHNFPFKCARFLVNWPPAPATHILLCHGQALSSKLCYQLFWLIHNNVVSSNDTGHLELYLPSCNKNIKFKLRRQATLIALSLNPKELLGGTEMVLLNSQQEKQFLLRFFGTFHRLVYTVQEACKIFSYF